MDDPALARAIASGDREAFRTLVEREFPRVYRMSYRILGRAEDAEDTAQDCFVTAYRSIRSYRGDGPLAAWLARIAVRQAFHQRRRRPRAGQLGVEAENQPDPAPQPPEAAIAAEGQRAIRTAVAALPETYREVVVLRYFAELPLADIAALTRRPLATVKTQVRRGLQRLRRTLDAEGAS